MGHNYLYAPKYTSFHKVLKEISGFETFLIYLLTTFLSRKFCREDAYARKGHEKEMEQDKRMQRALNAQTCY